MPTRNGGARRVSMFVTKGYKTRRMAVDHGIPLLTDVKCAKILVEVGSHVLMYLNLINNYKNSK